MNGLVLGVASAAIGAIVYAAFLRVMPRRLRLALLIVLLLAAWMVLGLALPLGAEDWLVGLVLLLSLGLAYALLLNGVLYDSPTLALVNEIEAHGSSGMPLTSFGSFVTRHPFVQSRIDALLEGRELGLVDGRLQLTGSAAHLLWLGDTYRALRGDARSGAG